tara:strand:+ start:18864 stop:19061 length:198 start_codon:yes stop_codon:yes gene_type:complete
MIEILIQFVQDQPWFGVAAATVALASSIAALTPTPAKGSFMSKVYSIVDLLALNVGKAKDKTPKK